MATTTIARDQEQQQKTTKNNKTTTQNKHLRNVWFFTHNLQLKQKKLLGTNVWNYSPKRSYFCSANENGPPRGGTIPGSLVGTVPDSLTLLGGGGVQNLTLQPTNIYIYIYIYVYVPLSLSFYPSAPLCLSLSLSIYLSIYLCLSSLSLSLSLTLSLSLSLSLSPPLSLSLPAHEHGASHLSTGKIKTKSQHSSIRIWPFRHTSSAWGIAWHSQLL